MIFAYFYHQPREVFAKIIARDFQIICFYSDPKCVMGGFSFQVQRMFSIFRLRLLYNEAKYS